MIIEYYDTYEYREQLLLLMDSDSKLQFLAAATFLGGHSLIVTLYKITVFVHLPKVEASEAQTLGLQIMKRPLCH